MDVLAGPEGLDQTRVRRVVGQDAQLHLGVVCGEQDGPFGRHEGLADANALLGADRDVLHVRIRRGEAAGGGAGLVEGGVDAAGRRVDQRRQRVDVGVLELGQAAVREDPRRELVVDHELLEHALVGGVARLGLANHRQLELLEEDALELFGTAHQELLARQRVDLALEARELALVLDREPRERALVHAHPGALHAGEDPGERHLHLVEERCQPVRFEPLAQLRSQGVYGARLLPGPGRDGLHRQLRRRDRLRAAPRQLLPAAQRLPQVRPGSCGQAARCLGIHQEGRHFDVHLRQRKRRAALFEQRLKALHVPPEPRPASALAERVSKRRGDAREVERAAGGSAAGDVRRAPFPERTGDPEWTRRHGAAPVGHTDQHRAGLGGQLVDQPRQLVGAGDQAGLHLEAPLRRRRARLCGGVEVFEQPREAQAGEERAELLAVGLAPRQIRQLQRQRDVLAQRRQLLRQARLGGVLLEGRARARRGHVGHVLEQLLEAAPLPDQLGGALLADALDAGDVVARITHQRANVQHPLRRHAEARLDLAGRVTAVLHGVEHAHALAHQLHQVLVGGDDGHVDVFGRHLDQGRDHVVRLEAIDLENRDPVGFHEFAHQG